MGEDCILFLMFCSSGALLSCLVFFQDVRQKERRDGEGGILEDGGRKGGEMEELLTCTCLQSLRIHCTIHLLCLYCHGWGQSDQTPIRFLILPPYVSPPPQPPTIHPPPPNTFFFLHVTCWLKERQCNSQAFPNGGNVRKGTHIKTMLSWRYSTVQKLQTNT